MKTFVTVSLAFALSVFTADARAVKRYAYYPISCSGGGEYETLTFDGTPSSTLTVTGYNLGSPEKPSSNVSIPGLIPASYPNIAYTGLSNGEFPPVVPGVTIAVAEGINRTFSVQSLYLGTSPGTMDNFVLLGFLDKASDAAATAIVPYNAGAAANGTMQFVDVVGSGMQGLSGLKAFSIKASSSGFDRPHALDNFTVLYDC